MGTFLERARKVFDLIKNSPKIEALDHVTDKEFELRTWEQVIKPILDEHNVIIVAGSFFGDEGKGKMTDAIARDPSITLVGRFNSGENAGHTVEGYVFHLVPSAIMVEGKTCVIGPECVMDPISFVQKEVSQLEEMGIDYRERLYVGNTHIVGPYHKILDFIVNPSNSSTLKGISFSHISKVWKKSIRLDDLFGSEESLCTKLKKDMTLYSALLKEIAAKDEDVLGNIEERESSGELSCIGAIRQFDKIYERKVLEDFKRMKAEGVNVPAHLIGFLEADNKVDFLVELYRNAVKENPLFPQRADVSKMVQDALVDGKILMECPQSYWLSNATEKHFGSSTSAQTHAAGVFASSLANIGAAKVAVINIAKTPGDSRVGRGANPAGFVNQTYFSDQGINGLDDLGQACIDYHAIQRQYFASIQDNGILEPTEFTDDTGTYCISEAMAISTSRHRNEKGATTGKPRVTGEFDCVAATQVRKTQGPYLFISALDRADDRDYFSLVVGYVFHSGESKEIDSNGKIYRDGDIIQISDQLPNEKVLEHCHKIIRKISLEGDKPIAANKFTGSEIPRGIQNVLGIIEDLTRFKIIGYGCGQSTDNVQYVGSIRR